MKEQKKKSDISLTVYAVFHKIRRQLMPVSKELSHREAEQILEHVLNIPRSEIYLNHSSSVDKIKYKEIRQIIDLRLTGKPLPHIIGYKYFYSKYFSVSPDVLIPRPDTEVLIDMVLKSESGQNNFFLDFGTGSGIIAETLCKAKHGWVAVALDISESALKIAKLNCSEQVNLLCCDKLLSIKEKPIFDFTVCNPPYISKKEMGKLEPDVVSYEPAIALYGGESGLEFYRYLAKHSSPSLKKGGKIYCEIGYNQSENVKSIFKNAGWNNIELFYDLANRPRVIIAENACTARE